MRRRRDDKSWFEVKPNDLHEIFSLNNWVICINIICKNVILLTYTHPPLSSHSRPILLGILTIPLAGYCWECANHCTTWTYPSADLHHNWPRLTPEDLCTNRLAESDRCAENFAGKPVPTAEDINTNLSFAPIPPPVWRVASSLAAVNASAPRRSTRSLVAYFGCDLHDYVAFSRYVITQNEDLWLPIERTHPNEFAGNRKLCGWCWPAEWFDLPLVIPLVWWIRNLRLAPFATYPVGNLWIRSQFTSLNTVITSACLLIGIQLLWIFSRNSDGNSSTIPPFFFLPTAPRVRAEI